MALFKLVVFLIFLSPLSAQAFQFQVIAEKANANIYQSDNFYLSVRKDDRKTFNFQSLRFFSLTRSYLNAKTFTDSGMTLEGIIYKKPDLEISLQVSHLFKHDFSESNSYILSLSQALRSDLIANLDIQKKFFENSQSNSQNTKLGLQYYSFLQFSGAISYANNKNGDSAFSSQAKIAQELVSLYLAYNISSGKEISDIGYVDQYTSHTIEISRLPRSVSAYYSRFDGQFRKEDLFGISYTYIPSPTEDSP